MLVAVTMVVSAVACVVGYVAVSRGTKYYTTRRRGGFNCCEFCRAELPLDPERSWRYAGTCERCGRVQTWALL